MDFLKNKTLLFNIAFVVLGVATALLGTLGYAEFKPDVDLVAIVGAVVALINAVVAARKQ